MKRTNQDPLGPCCFPANDPHPVSAPNSLDNVVKSPHHGFGSHQQQVKSIVSLAVQQGHGQLGLVLHLGHRVKEGPQL